MKCSALIVALCLLLPSAGAAAESNGSGGRSVGRRVLEAPEYVLDAIAWPLQRAVNWAERTDLPERITDALYFNEERTAGWLPNVSFGGEIESGVGFKLFHHSLYGAGEEIDLSTLFSAVDADERQIGVRFFDPAVRGTPVTLLADVFYSDDQDDEFFVRTAPDDSVLIGRDVSEDDEVEVALRTVHVRLRSAWQLQPSTEIGLGFEPIFGETGVGEGETRAIPAGLEGFDDSIVLVGGGPYFEWDARNSPVRPHWGWYARISTGLWSAVDGETADDDDFRYARYQIDLRRYQPTFRHDPSIVLRAFLDRVETVDGAVPFWELPALDEDNSLRGFERNRFRDRGALLFNVEYRYPIWETWDAFLFLDEGQVFAEYSDIEADAFEWSAGGGVQFLTASSFLFQIRVATSDEDTRFKIDLTRAF